MRSTGKFLIFWSLLRGFCLELYAILTFSCNFMFCRCWYLVADMMKKVLGREMSAGISPDRGNTRNYLTPILILMSNDTNQGFISRPSQHDQKIDILNFPYDQVSVRQTFLYSKYNNIPKLPSRQHIYENTNLFIMKLLKPLLCSMVSKISTPYVKRIRYFLQWRCSTNIPLSIVVF